MSDRRTPAGVGAPRCRGCGGARPRRVADLGPQPAGDAFPAPDAPGPDPRRPLELWFCPDCTLVQLGPVEPPPEQQVRAVESRTHRRHARRVVGRLLAEHPGLAGGTVREFCSHHGGSWLEALAGRGCRAVGEREPAGLVVDVHALAHEPDVAGALTRLAAALAPGGLLVVEHHHLLPLVEQSQFDTVRHGHWSYLSLTALDRLAGRHGLRVVRAVEEAVFGGSLLVVLAHRESGARPDGTVADVLARERSAGLHDGTGPELLGQQARRAARGVHDFLTAERAAGRRVLGYGAPSKAAVLLGLSEVGPDLLEFTVDAAPLKHGLSIAGVRVPIRPVGDLVAARPDVVLVLTWDIADEVIGALETGGGWGARYVLPVPAPHTRTPRGTR